MSKINPEDDYPNDYRKVTDFKVENPYNTPGVSRLNQFTNIMFLFQKPIDYLFLLLLFIDFSEPKKSF